MAKQLQKTFSTLDLIAQGRTINSWHVSQMVDAFTGAEEFDISILGSLSLDGKLFLNLPSMPPRDRVYTQSTFLALDPINNQVYTTAASATVYPIELNPLTKTAWNSGRGNLNNNTNFGYLSFIRNTTGDNNTIYGSNNAINNTTGGGLTVIGTRNLNAGSNLDNVIAIGNQVLFNSQSGENIGGGLRTLYNLKYGTNNIGFGNYTLYNSISGDNNLALGNYSASLNKGNNNVTLGHSSLPFDELGSNRITIGTFAGRNIGDGWLEIHSYSDVEDDSAPLVLGNFNERWFRINGGFSLDLASNPIAPNISITPDQLLFDSNGKAYITPRGYTRYEADNIFQVRGNYLTLEYLDENYYDKDEINTKLTSVYKTKGSVANFSALPTTGNIAGDVWNLISNGDNYVWVLDLNNTGLPGWDKLSGITDLSGYVPTSRKLSINGTQFDLSADRSWTVPEGTVTSVGMTVPTGLSIAGSPITGAGVLAVSLASGYIIPTQALIDSKNAGLVTTTLSTGTSNAVTGNTNTFLNIVQGGASPGSSTQVTGTGSISVSSDANGKLTINGTDSNTTYTAGTGLLLTGTVFSTVFGTTSGTSAAGNDSRFHNQVTLGTANGLSLNTQVLSLALATQSSPGAMSSDDKTKLDGLGGDTWSQTFGSTTITTYNIDHNLGSKYVIVQIYEELSGKSVEMEVITSTINRVIININNPPDIANKYRVVVKK